jgi:uncharacterized metal-binding protein (TIGR02443 family)
MTKVSMTKKRFIAGATCPACQAMDTLCVYHENNIEHVTCVACDYHAQQGESTPSTSTTTSDAVPISFIPKRR